MNYLFLDTTNGLTIGLLSDKIEWLFYEKLSEKKPSEVIHSKINKILESHKISFKEITLITLAGPGSYTGMRLSEGIAHILKLCDVPVISFFHFEVPSMLGVKSGKWVTNAFKGQFFIYEWNGEVSNKKLVDSLDLNAEIYSNSFFDSNLKIILTDDLIKDNAKEIFQKVISRNEFLPAYYFRTLDEEFKSI
jgi:tRNA threonylcarbamoyladenosine biosynthesis protein TsaB